jgi:hypothetical protein
MITDYRFGITAKEGNNLDFLDESMRDVPDGTVVAVITENYGNPDQNRTWAIGESEKEATGKLREQFASKVKPEWRFIIWEIERIRDGKVVDIAPGPISWREIRGISPDFFVPWYRRGK